MTDFISREDLPKPAKALRGFSDINRYWDRQRKLYAAKILPGQYYVTTQDELIVTVLGSCVSACIRDPAMGIGGMNHFMLPLGADSSKLMSRNSDATRYGNFAMEKLINDILKNGGRRDYLEIKVFGGGKVIQHMTETDIGGRNIRFVREFLATEGFSIASEDLGDVSHVKLSTIQKVARCRSRSCVKCTMIRLPNVKLITAQNLKKNQYPVISNYLIEGVGYEQDWCARY